MGRPPPARDRRGGPQRPAHPRDQHRHRPGPGSGRQSGFGRRRQQRRLPHPLARAGVVGGGAAAAACGHRRRLRGTGRARVLGARCLSRAAPARDRAGGRRQLPGRRLRPRDAAGGAVHQVRPRHRGHRHQPRRLGSPRQRRQRPAAEAAGTGAGHGCAAHRSRGALRRRGRRDDERVRPPCR